MSIELCKPDPTQHAATVPLNTAQRGRKCRGHWGALKFRTEHSTLSLNNAPNWRRYDTKNDLKVQGRSHSARRDSSAQNGTARQKVSGTLGGAQISYGAFNTEPEQRAELAEIRHK